MLGDYVAFLPYNSDLTYFPYIEASENQVIALGEYEELVP